MIVLSMATYYDHNDIEKKWQEKWEKDGVYRVDSDSTKPKFYALSEFAYPSGNLHVGHWYAFAVPDIYARYKRMSGYNVLYPFGFDSFGLPAENAAIKHNKDPKEWTYGNIENMRKQLVSMGACFDWSREIATSNPDYYKWTQEMFARFFENDLAYRAGTKVNWCPKDKTVLANEQVVDGKCDRCGSEVEQKDQEQWMLRITDFADALVDDLEALDWPEHIKDAQRNWIGRSEGSEIVFKVGDVDVPVFTTRPDTLFGVTYLVLAPEHPLVQKLAPQIQNMDEVESYIDQTKKKSELDRQQSKEKTGVQLQGISAVNPANGEEIPVWVADYVLAGYGTGAVMAVPAHDERDNEFAKKFNLSTREVVVPSIEDTNNPQVEGWEVKERRNIHAVVYDPKRDAYLTLKWYDYDWQTVVLGGIEDGEDEIETAKREVAEETGYTNIEFKKHLGSPIQTLYAAPHKGVNRTAWSTGLYFELVDDTRVETAREENEKFDVVWMPAKDFVPENITNIELAAWLERIAGEEKIFTGKGVLFESGEFTGMTSDEAKEKITEKVGGQIKKTYRLRDWGISRQRYWGCPIPIVYGPDGAPHRVPAEHLPWTLPEDVDFTPDGTAPLARSKELFERTEKIFGQGWTPEVETMDTFVDSSWYFYRYLDPKNEHEFAGNGVLENWMPVDMYFGGAEHTTMHLLYSRFWVKAMQSIGMVSHSEPYKRRMNRGLILDHQGLKMSKSKGNVVDPDEVVKNVGADTVRMYLAFMGPYGSANYPWDPNGVVGVRRFLEKTWRLHESIADTDTLDKKVHKLIAEIGADIDQFKFNTCISKMMIFVSEAEKTGITKTHYETLLKLLSVFAPHMSEELWYMLGNTESIHLQDWPTYDESMLVEDEVTFIIQVNGKLRARIEMPSGSTQDEVFAQAMADEGVSKFVEGEPKKVIFVQDKLLNIVA